MEEDANGDDVKGLSGLRQQSRMRLEGGDEATYAVSRLRLVACNVGSNLTLLVGDGLCGVFVDGGAHFDGFRPLYVRSKQIIGVLVEDQNDGN